MGESCIVERVGGEGSLRQHFLDMGIIPGVRVTLIKFAPMGDPMELRIHSYELTLRLADAEQIDVRPITAEDQEPATPAIAVDAVMGQVDSPRYGEASDKPANEPLPDDATLSYALVGNQNCGKTTLFNQLTGSNQHVGNFPGVTVDRKD